MNLMAIFTVKKSENQHVGPMGSKWGHFWGHLTYFTNLGVIFGVKTGVKTGVKWVKNGNFSSFSDIL